MLYDGDNLNVYKDIISAQGDTLSSDTLSIPAYSGRSLAPNGEFRFDKERQKMVNEGPIPEGNYYINPKNIIVNKSAQLNDAIDYIVNAFNTAAGAVKMGHWPGGKTAWGRGRIDILPEKIEIDGVERSGLTIHGGDIPGSAGCIDLLDREVDLFNYLREYGSDSDSIPLKVDYSKKNIRK